MVILYLFGGKLIKKPRDSEVELQGSDHLDRTVSFHTVSNPLTFYCDHFDSGSEQS